jgi:dephospho-CoA kinase
VGLTGGIGSGKTTVCNCFSELGVPIIDADRISHDLTRRGGAASGQVAELFGPGAVDAGGTLRRDYIRDRVFRDPALRRKLEEIIHPLVYREMQRAIDEVRFPYCIVCIPLMLETHCEEYVDRILVVDAPEKLQVERVCRRDGSSPEAVERIMQNQCPRPVRTAAADDLIHNDRDQSYLRDQVHRLHQNYLVLSGEHVESSP